MKYTPLSLPLSLALYLLCVIGADAAPLGDARCYRCHKELPERFAAGTPHDPVREGDCFACHDPHGAARELRLITAVPDLCLRCHDDPAGAHPHAPVAKGDCLACHDPHNSPQKALLTQAPQELCATCHDLRIDPGFAHSRNCVGCHGSHGGDWPRVLSGSYPAKRRVPFSEEAYELCFRCHSPRAITEAGATAPTGFRDEHRNLHYLHVVGGSGANPYDVRTDVRRKPGLACNACHAVHGSPQDKAVLTSFERNGFAMYSLEFRRTAWEGSCAGGCHKPTTYRRTATEDVTTGPGSDINRAD